jgi:hypothetical protein
MFQNFGFVNWIALGATLVVFAVWVIPKLQARSAKSYLSETELPMAENEFRKTIAQVVSGLFVLGGFFFTWEQLRNSQDNFERTVKLQEQGRITERLTRATEQLNDDKRLAVRLGGVYALQRLLRESPEAQDTDHISQILAAFVRETAMPASASVNQPSSGGSSIPKDVSASISAIAARPLDAAEVTRRLEDTVSTTDVDLRGLNLRHLYPRGTLRRRPNFSFLDLECSDLEGAALIYSDLIDTDLGQANLGSADLSHADLRKAILDEANLANAELNGANLEHVSMNQTIFVRVDLRSTNITKQQVDSACLDEYTVQHLPQGIEAPEPCQREYKSCRGQF